MNMLSVGKKARAASKTLAHASTDRKNDVLLSLAKRLSSCEQEILAANQIDMSDGEGAGLSTAMLDRLCLNEGRLSGMAADLRSVSALPDPVGEVYDRTNMPNGLRVHKQRVPLGVLGVIYEARPNVTVDVASLAIKTGNAVVLRGGSETINSNRALVRVIRSALEDHSLPADAVQFIDDPDRQRVMEMLQMQDYIDMLIPRGGAGLHQFCRENSRIPVITGGIGICHLYVDETADLTAALGVIRNAKIQRPTVCNALDTLLVHQAVAQDFLPAVVSLLERDGVTFRADVNAQQALGAALGSIPASVSPAGAGDFDTEWLSLVLGLRVVPALAQAIEHIAQHSTGHSDGILTRDEGRAREFVEQVDSAAVYINASTRFTDGSQLGLGAEVAISTQRLHARGPMALRELTTYKWVIEGDYHVRA